MVAPSTSALLTEWNWEPSVLVGMALVAAGYYYAVGPLRRRHNLGPPATGKQATYFTLSLAILVVALLSPLDAIGDRYLFSAHMIQHLLLATLWPPLVVMSIPGWLAQAFFRLPVSAVVGFFVQPAMALVLFNVDIYLWHLPALYDLTLSNEYVHIGEHLSFMVFGLFNWWPVLSPITGQRLAAPLQTLYLFLDGMLMMVLGIVFTFSPVVFYSPYAAAPRLWGISALTDQQIGGLIMWYPGNLPYGVLMVIAFFRWFDTGGPSYTEAQPLPSEAQRIPTQSPTIGPPAS
jgi:cytochrome c oxidase assembly factor CtaG